VFYTPYFLFPVRRQSGLLIPELGYSSSDGFFANNEIFWAISDYKDMTLYSDYREQVGHGTGVEYRYLNSRESSGEMYYKYFDLYHAGESRWNFRFLHQEEFAEDLSARADINLVSDERYFMDLERKLELRSRPWAWTERLLCGAMEYRRAYVMASIRSTLPGRNEKTIQKLPELRYTIFDETVAGPLHLNFEGSAVNFTRRDEDGARRVDFNPRLTAVFGGSGLSFTPRAGYQATFYDRSTDSVELVERKYFYAGADVNARISRVFGADAGAGIGRIRHSIEPTVSYTYVPHVTRSASRNSMLLIPYRTGTSHRRLDQPVDGPLPGDRTLTFTTFDLMVMRLSQSHDLNAARAKDPGTAQSRSEVLGNCMQELPNCSRCPRAEPIIRIYMP
jgi:LPS-assembly protein